MFNRCNTHNNQTPPTMKPVKPAKEIVLVTPDSNLNESELKYALELQKKAPHIVKAHAAVGKAMSSLRGKWLDLVEACRETVDGVTPNGRELSLLLRSLGESRSRVSEIVKVSTVDQATFDRYKAGLIGFKAVLRIARGNIETPPAAPGDAEPEAEAEGTESKPTKPSKHAFATLPEALSTGFADLLSEHTELLADNGPEEPNYGLVYQVGTKTFRLVLSVSDTAVKPLAR